LDELRAALTAAQANQATVPTTPRLIPKPRGTSGRGDFNLENEMGIETALYREIQASTQLRSSILRSPHPQNFVRFLVNTSAIDKSQQWKNQPGVEIHKIFTVVSLLFTFTESATSLIHVQTVEKYPVMATFEYNWATAEMAKLYLRNSRAQAKCKAKSSNSGTGRSVNSGLVGTDTEAGTNTGLTGGMTGLGDELDSDSDSDNE
jgi:hypothetical protein